MNNQQGSRHHRSGRLPPNPQRHVVVQRGGNEQVRRTNSAAGTSRRNTHQNAQRHAVDAGGNDEEAGRHHEPGRRNTVKDQERGKGARARFFSGHVAQATDVHEQVTDNYDSIQEGKEAPGQQ